MKEIKLGFAGPLQVELDFDENDYEFLGPDDIVGWCNECGSQIKNSESEYTSCTHCFAQLDILYTEEVEEYYKNLEAASRTIDIASVADLRQLIETYEEQVYLCCNRLDEHCTCEIPVAIEDLEGILPHEEKEKAYAYESRCSACVHFYEPTCIPYRAWLKCFYEDAESPGEIDVCSDFEADPSVINVKVKVKN